MMVAGRDNPAVRVGGGCCRILQCLSTFDERRQGGDDGAESALLIVVPAVLRQAGRRGDRNGVGCSTAEQPFGTADGGS